MNDQSTPKTKKSFQKMTTKPRNIMPTHTLTNNYVTNVIVVRYTVVEEHYYVKEVSHGTILLVLDIDNGRINKRKIVIIAPEDQSNLPLYASVAYDFIAEYAGVK